MAQQLKGVQYTTGTVHIARRIKDRYDGKPRLVPACGFGWRVRHFLGEAPESEPVTCRRCGKEN